MSIPQSGASGVVPNEIKVPPFTYGSPPTGQQLLTFLQDATTTYTEFEGVYNRTISLTDAPALATRFNLRAGELETQVGVIGDLLNEDIKGELNWKLTLKIRTRTLAEGALALAKFFEKM